MMDKKLAIRIMHRDEISIAINWAANEGWNPGNYDAHCFYAADPDGFLIGLFGDEPVAIISVVKYGESFGFLGFYIVNPMFRGKGYGIQIWNAGMKYLKGRNIGLDGVVDQQNNYEKSGFKFAYNNIRYEGIGGGDFTVDSNIINLSTIPYRTVESYDRTFFPENRTKFIDCWIKQPNHIALGIMSNDKICGYGVIRKCRLGYKIGPLFANDIQLAQTLYQALVSHVHETGSIYIDIPEINIKAIALAKKYNLNPVFRTARMYTGEIPNISIDRTYGVTSFELG